MNVPLRVLPALVSLCAGLAGAQDFQPLAALNARRRLKAFPALREVASLYCGSEAGFWIHLPGHVGVLYNCLASVSIRVHPWLNSGF
jgi:hypothetical protein